MKNYINRFLLLFSCITTMTTGTTSNTPASSPVSAPKKAAPRKASSKTAAKAPKTVAKPASTKKTTRKAAAPAKPPKVKKPKLVRDSFTIPKDEYTALSELKQRCAKLAQPAKKSELLRAGIKALAALSDKALLAALKAVPSIKTGRPKKA
jgi:hypothetical protein